MRPLLFFLGLAFVATVLIANVDAMKCYAEGEFKGRHYARETVDCDDAFGVPRGTFTECGTFEISNNKGDKAALSFCLIEPMCGATEKGVTLRCTSRCGTDLCNDGPLPSLNGNGNGNSNGNDNGNDGPPSGALTYTPPAPLLVALITGVIAAFGI